MIWGLLIFAGAWWLATKRPNKKDYTTHEDYMCDIIEDAESDKDYK